MHIYSFFQILFPYRFEKWNISCCISKERTSQSPVIAALPCKLMSPEDTQGGNSTWHRAAIRLQLVPTVSPEETQAVQTGYWRPVTEVCIGGMISGNPTLASSHSQKSTKSLNVRYLVLFH